MDPEAWEIGLQQSQNSQVILRLIETLQKQGLSLHNDGEEVQVSTSPSYVDVTAEHRQEVRTAAMKMQWSIFSVAQAQELFESYKLQMQRVARMRQDCFLRTGIQEFSQASGDWLMPEQSRGVITAGLISYAICPRTRTASKRPLNFAHIPTLQDHIHTLTRSPISKNLDLRATLLGLLKSCSDTGHTPDQVVMVLKELMRRYLPQLYPVCSNKFDFWDILETILSAIDINVDVTRVQNTISNLVRPIGMSITELAHVLQALQIELYTLQNSRQAAHVRKKRAQAQVLRVLGSFLEDSARGKWERYKALKKRKDEELSLDQALTYLSHLETDPKHRLKTEKTFDKNLANVLVNTGKVQSYGNVFRKGKSKIKGMSGSYKSHGKSQHHSSADIYQSKQRGSHGGHRQHSDDEDDMNDDGYRHRHGNGADDDSDEDSTEESEEELEEESEEEIKGSHGNKEKVEKESFFEDNLYFCPSCLCYSKKCKPTLYGCYKHPNAARSNKACGVCRGFHVSGSCLGN